MIPETTIVGVGDVWSAVAGDHDGDRDPSGDFSLEFPSNRPVVDGDPGRYRYPGQQRVDRQ